MVWVQAFPQGATLIAQSVQQFQDNWLFLQNNINTDHFFNTGSPTEGHHRQVQFQNQGSDPAVAIDSVFYSKSQNSKAQPFFRNSNDIRQGILGAQGSTSVGAGGGSVTAFTAPANAGAFMSMCYVNGTPSQAFSFSFTCDGSNVTPFGFQQNGGVFTAISGTGLVINVTTTILGAFTLNYFWWGIQY